MRFDTPLRARHEAYVRSIAGAASADRAASARPGAATGQRQAAAGIDYIPYGPIELKAGPGCELPAVFDAVETEYAAIRRGAGLLDAPHRGTIRVTGADRRDFLGRMVTQQLEDLAAGVVRESFLLNRQGRIEADLLVIDLGDWIYLDVDVHQAAGTVALLEGFLFTEDVDLRDETASMHRIALHGVGAVDVLAAASGTRGWTLGALRAGALEIAGVEVIAARRDQVGAPGVELLVPRVKAERVWEALLAADAAGDSSPQRVRPVGWYAFNTARIEAGTPLFNIDFGTTNLPHETGVLRERVSFEKGCYPGQEVVARLENLGRPKQQLRGLRLTGDGLPLAGAEVLPRGSAADAAAIGVVTSSTLSPMLSAAPVAFAMMRSEALDEGTPVAVSAEGQLAEAEVASLRFWPAAATGAQPEGG